MKNYRLELSTYDIRSLCIQNNWFTHGTNEQYERLFNMAESGADVHTLAAIIWTCSDPDCGTLVEIAEKLEDRTRYPIYLNSLIRELDEDGYEDTTLKLIREIITTHPEAGKAYRLITD